MTMWNNVSYPNELHVHVASKVVELQALKVELENNRSIIDYLYVRIMSLLRSLGWPFSRFYIRFVTHRQAAALRRHMANPNHMV